MRAFWITACTLVVLGGGVAIVTPAGRDERRASTPPEGGQLVMAGLAEPGRVAESQPPRAVVRGCAARISGGAQRRDSDTIIGPLRFNMHLYSPLRAWRRQVRSGQWLKSPARLRAGAQVTLVVPPEQRAWMRLAYAHRRGGAAAVTLRACRHRRSRAARRRECVWAEGVVGSPGIDPRRLHRVSVRPHLLQRRFRDRLRRGAPAGTLRRADRLGRGRAGAAPGSTATCPARRVRQRSVGRAFHFRVVTSAVPSSLRALTGLRH